jgi:hypothetical protein
MVDTFGVLAKKQVVAPFLIAQCLWFQRSHNMSFATVAKLFFFSVFPAMGAVD